jgi:hypothetical protein
MSVANAIFDSVALLLSFTAVVISVISAHRQATAARRANVMSLFSALGQRARSPEFLEAQTYVQTSLDQYDPNLGLHGLPRPARDYALLVGYFYQDVGALVTTGVIDEDLAVAMYYTNIKDAWHALEPYIRGETKLRRSRGGGPIFGSFEHIAAYAESVSVDRVRSKFVRRSFPPAVVDAQPPVVDPTLGDRLGAKGST